MCPIAYTAPTMTSMKANEIMPSWAMEKATLVPDAITPVAAAAPPPTYTRNAVPSPSARSFWWVVGGAAIRVARGLRRGRLTSFGERGEPTRNLFDIVERCFTKHKPGTIGRSRGESRFRRDGQGAPLMLAVGGRWLGASRV